jgi:hypothetical protein
MTPAWSERDDAGNVPPGTISADPPTEVLRARFEKPS